MAHVFWYEWFAIVFLVSMSGLFSGLNLGLMGLDQNQLDSVMAGDEPNASFARRIKPLRNQGNWLLCTLLLGNVAVNAELSIILARLGGGALALLISTALIVVFGEIIPQALCSRHALVIGANTRYAVYVLMALMSPIAWPVSLMLDWVLGAEIGNIYSNKELEKLVQIHANVKESDVSQRVATVLSGAMGLDSTLVRDVMTPAADVFHLPDDERLTFDVLSRIFKSGHSRVPIIHMEETRKLVDDHYMSVKKKKVVGVLYVKDLILIDPDDELPVIRIMQAFGHKKPPIVYPDYTLNEALKVFTKRKQHIAVVHELLVDCKGEGGEGSELDEDSAVFGAAADSSGTRLKGSRSRGRRPQLVDGDFDSSITDLTGIITLEDVIEEVLQAQLIDEHDNYEDRIHHKKTGRLARINWDQLQIFDHRKARLTSLPPQELQAVYHFLTQAVRAFQPQYRTIGEASIKNLLQYSKVVRVVVDGGRDDLFSATYSGDDKSAEERLHAMRHKMHVRRDPYKLIENNGLLLYQQDQKTDYFTLILDGSCEIFAGRQGFRSECHCWSYLCPEALAYVQTCVNGRLPIMDYVSDFTCKVQETSRVLRISLRDFKACLEGKFEPAALESAREGSRRDPISTDSGKLVLRPLETRPLSDTAIVTTAMDRVRDKGVGASGGQLALEKGSFQVGRHIHEGGVGFDAVARAKSSGAILTATGHPSFYRLVQTQADDFDYTYRDARFEERTLYHPSLGMEPMGSNPMMAPAIAATPGSGTLYATGPPSSRRFGMTPVASGSSSFERDSPMLFPHHSGGSMRVVTPKAAESMSVPPGYVLLPITDEAVRQAGVRAVYHAASEPVVLESATASPPAMTEMTGIGKEVSSGSLPAEDSPLLTEDAQPEVVIADNPGGAEGIHSLTADLEISIGTDA